MRRFFALFVPPGLMVCLLMIAGGSPVRAVEPEPAVESVVARLVETLRDEDTRVCVEAVDALARLGPQASPAVEPLVELTGHEDAWLRVAAIQALAAIGKPAVPALIDRLENGDGPAPFRAAMILRAMKHEAVDAVPALERVVAHGSERLKTFAADALADIQSARSTDQVASPPGEPRAMTHASAVSIGFSSDGSDDWPQFHGPRQDSICTETGLFDAWPEGGPELVWKLEGLGKGFSTVSIVEGRLFTMGEHPDATGDDAQFVLAYDLDSREPLWATRVGPPHKDGPRCTPTVDGELLYALGTDADLVCLESATGKVRWRKNLATDFGGKMMSIWKFSESPLVDGPRLICTPGHPDATVVALDKLTGETIWTSKVPADFGNRGKDGAGYGWPVVAEIEGVRQYLVMFGRGVVSVEATSGRVLWGYNRIANRIANITSPVVRGNHVFVTTSYKTGSALLEISRTGETFTAREVYFLGPEVFENHHGGVVLVGDYLYGGDGQNKGTPVCLHVPTGKIAWKVDAPEGGSAATLYADGHVLFRYDRGPIYLIEATPTAYRVKGHFTPELGKGPAWPHPVIHRGKLYLRHGDKLLCYQVGRVENPAPE